VTVSLRLAFCKIIFSFGEMLLQFTVRVSTALLLMCYASVRIV
jgi:hypothetical protein